jgi:hypothetical protein
MLTTARVRYDAPVPAVKVRQDSATPEGGGRRRRPRQETRTLFLQAGTRVAVDRMASPSAQNLLAGVRVTDVLAEINASTPDQVTTTGAFYQIWTSQADFQRELLAHVMDQIAVPGADELTTLVFNLVAQRATPDVVFQRLADEDFRLTRQSPELFLAIGLGALAPAELVEAAQRDANQQYVASMSRVLNGLIAYAGLRMQPGRTIEVLIWAIEALTVGYLLRSRTHPDVPERANSGGRTARATAFIGLVRAFTEPIPHSE